jgi:probable addiction module antidote protein
MVKTYSQWRLEKLSDPERAARYLNAAKRDSKEAFLHAVKNVVQANQVARVAREAGVSRESVYRSFSADGNPTFDTLSAILEALNIGIEFVSVESSGARGLFVGPRDPSRRRVWPSAEPQSANLATSGSIVGGYVSGMPIGTSTFIGHLDVYAFAGIPLAPLLSVEGVPTNLSLAGANAGRELGFLPGFLQQQQQQMRQESFNE